MYFDFRDVLRGPRFALSPQKIWLQFLGLAGGFVLYLLFTYLAFLVSGYGLNYVWIRYGLLPCLFATGDVYPWYAWLVYGIGTLLFVTSMLVAQTAVSRAVFEQARANNFYTWEQGCKYATKKAGAVVLAPLSLWILIGLMILAGIVFSLFGKIPFVGNIGTGLFMIIWFTGALFGFYFLVVSAVTLILAPSIIATADEDAFEVIFQAFSSTWKQPWRLLSYLALNAGSSFVAVAVMAFFAKKAVHIMNSVFGTFMGSDYINLANNGQAFVQSMLLPAQVVMENLSEKLTALIYFSKEFIVIPSSQLPFSVELGSWFYAGWLLVLVFWIASYGLSSFAAGNTLLYLAIRVKKDNVNLIDRANEEEAEEAKKEAESQDDEPVGSDEK